MAIGLNYCCCGASKVIMKNRIYILFLLLLVCVQVVWAQGQVKGRILEKQTNDPLEFINVAIRKHGETKIFKGAISDMEGNFLITGLPNGQYTLTASFTGYKEVVRQFTVSAANQNHNYPALYMAEDTKALEEVTVVGQRSEMKLEVDRKSFNVDQQISNAGSTASEVLENIPSVEVDNEGNVSLRGNSSVEVWINGKASGLTSDNRGEILQQMPAESIERIEVIDNPSAKFSAEGSAGIINIVLKKERRAGYYGSVQAGGNSRGGANTSFNINYNSSLIDAYLNVGYRHRAMKDGGWSRQTFLNNNTYQNYDSEGRGHGNNLFSRAGLTLHATRKDDISLSGMLMYGGHNRSTPTPYHYGTVGAPYDSRLMTRLSGSDATMRMLHGELGWRHNFTDRHFLDFSVSYNQWKMDEDNVYRDSTVAYNPDGTEDEQGHSASYQLRPMRINDRSWEVKLDYENPISDHFTLQTGYQGNFSKQGNPQQSFVDASSWTGNNLVEEKDYYNNFSYRNDIHALYATANLSLGRFGVMAGLRGEYWRVKTESLSWEQEQNPSLRTAPYKKDFFELFPSLFLSYQLPRNQQLQLNYTRRLRRPWGGQLNPFRNTSDATMVSFGNPELTPEYSHSFALNYLKTWTEHSMLLSAYYRPTTDVMERITYQGTQDGMMYQTEFNVAKSLSTGLEVTLKDKLFRILDLSTSANFYYFKLDGYQYRIDGQTISDPGNDNFTWNARVQASLMLPYGLSFQATGRYRSRETVAQGYRKGSGSIDLGLRKSFLNRSLVVSLNCRDLLNSRKWKTYTASDAFVRDQERWHNGRTVRLTVTWNFGNMTQKRPQMHEDPSGGMDIQQQYGGSEE